VAIAESIPVAATGKHRLRPTDSWQPRYPSALLLSLTEAVCTGRCW